MSLARAHPRFALDIREAPEPSDVQYENMEHGGWDRFGRTLVTLVCSYTALGLGFFLISLTTASRSQVGRRLRDPSAALRGWGTLVLCPQMTGLGCGCCCLQLAP